MQKIILNKCYGGFGFCKQFMEELFERYPGDQAFWGKPGECRIWQWEKEADQLAPFCEGYSIFCGTLHFREDASGLWFSVPTEGFTNGGVLLRSDPRVVALFEEWQSEDRNPSGAFASLCLETAPEHWNWRVAEHDGMETLEKEFPWKDVLDDLLKGERTHPLTRKLQDEKLTVEQYLEQVQPRTRWY